MTITKQYLTYQEYKDLGGNVTLNEVPFNLLELEVEKIIDKYTFNRLTGLENQSNEVKACVFKLINTLNYSVEYKNGTPQEKDAIEKEIIENFLATYKVENTPVMYRGI